MTLILLLGDGHAPEEAGLGVIASVQFGLVAVGQNHYLVAALAFLIHFKSAFDTPARVCSTADEVRGKPVRKTTSLVLAVLGLTLAASSAAAAPVSLLHSLLDPGTKSQPNAVHGADVAVDGDIAVVGAPWASVSQDLDGVVKVYHMTAGWLMYTLRNPTPESLDQFGSAVSVSAGQVVIGAAGDNTWEAGAGSAYVYDLLGATPTAPVLTLHNPSPSADDAFANAVASFDTRIVVAALNDDTGASNSGIVYVFDRASTTPTVPVLTLTNPSPAMEDHFGWSVAISGSYVVVGAEGDDTGANNAGSAYVYDLAGTYPLVPILTLNNPMPINNDNFGRAVSISGSRLVVGADAADRQFLNSGAVYVYDLARTNPAVPVLTLANPHLSTYSYFGSDVSLSGSRLVVGAYYDNISGFNAGVAYVFNLDGATPGVPVVTLHNPAPAESDYFGDAVAISGTHVVVGAYGDDSLANTAGNAYAYNLASANPAVPFAHLSGYLPAARDYFGAGVAVSGTRVVVGAYGDDTGMESSGVAYVFDLGRSTPTTPALVLTNPSPAFDDWFGHAVAISGNRVVIGAEGDDAGANGAGRAYVYDLSRSDPRVPVVTLNNPSPGANDYFGNAVAIDGARVVIGASLDDAGAANAGSAYVYDLTGVSPGVPVAILTNPSPATSDYFGYSVAISGTRVWIGAPNDDTGALNAGSVYLYDLTSTNPRLPVLTLTHPEPTPNQAFGISVAISGTRAVVGATGDDLMAVDAGSAQVYDLASDTPTVPVLTLTHPSPAAYDAFGDAVAISGTRVAIGVPQQDYNDDEQYGAGGACVYDLACATPAVPVATLTNPSPAWLDQFGSSVALDGTTVVVGTPFDDGSAFDRGAAYIFGVGPTLHVVPAAPGLATISWTPATSAGVVLQYADSFASTNWFDAPSGAANPVNVPSTNASRCYRLVQRPD